jgi:hypothetical protein
MNLASSGRETGRASAIAHPIQGLVKYHGLRDFRKRIPFHDSISMATAPIHTHTSVAVMDQQGGTDEGIVDGQGLVRFFVFYKAAFYDLLQKSVADTLLSLSRDPRHLGAEIGFISVLHTWGQNMMDHPHVHCIVPAGGLVDGKRWKACKGKFLFPFKVMSSLFKGKMLSGFKRAVEKGDIRLHGHLGRYADPVRLKACLDGLYAKNWVAYCKPPFAGAGQVLKYLGGYTHRMAISNHRIVSIDENTVRFKWRSYADGGKTKVMTLAHAEFIRRFLLSVAYAVKLASRSSTTCGRSIEAIT